MIMDVDGDGGHRDEPGGEGPGLVAGETCGEPIAPEPRGYD